jgi:hypothetical protein
MGPILDLEGPLRRASLPILLGGPIGLFEVRSLGPVLFFHPFPFLSSTKLCGGAFRSCLLIDARTSFFSVVFPFFPLVISAFFCAWNVQADMIAS